jgi:WhiB family transcriptional regulator, redox-sensing transcriptional regulator
METNIDELLDTKGVTVAYRYPTPRSTALSWNCAGYADPEVFDPIDDDALAKAQAVCAGCGVRTLCLALGISRDEWGVWGGVLLENGAPVQKVKRRGRPRKGAAA